MLNRFSDYIRHFIPSFSKDEVESQIDFLKEECVKHTYPLFDEIVKNKVFTGEDPFQSVFAKKYNSFILERMRNKTKLRNPNTFDLIHFALSTLPEKLDLLNSFMKNKFGDVIVKENITYAQATVLRFLELVEFSLIYARRFINHTLTCEYEALKSSYVSVSYPDAIIAWLESNVSYFIDVLNILTKGKDEFISAIGGIPDVIIDKDPTIDDAYVSRAGEAKVDPLYVGLVPPLWNPIYHVRKMYAVWFHERFEQRKAERELVLLRIEQYIQAKENGEDNARIDQIIEKLNERLQRIDIKIAKMSEKYVQKRKV